VVGVWPYQKRYMSCQIGHYKYQKGHQQYFEGFIDTPVVKGWTSCVMFWIHLASAPD